MCDRAAGQDRGFRNRERHIARADTGGSHHAGRRRLAANCEPACHCAGGGWQAISILSRRRLEQERRLSRENRLGELCAAVRGTASRIPATRAQRRIPLPVVKRSITITYVAPA